MRPLLDGGIAVVEDNRSGRGGLGRSTRAAGSRAAGTLVGSLVSPGVYDQALIADELPDGLVVAEGVARTPNARPFCQRPISLPSW